MLHSKCSTLTFQKLFEIYEIFLPFIAKHHRRQLNKTVTMQNIDLPKTAVGLKINTAVILWSTFPTDRQTITEMQLYSEIIFKLDSLRWFSQRRSPTPYFCEVHTQGTMTPTLELRQDFCTMHLLLKFHHPMFTCSEAVMLTNKQTNRRRSKHRTLFAILWCWIIKLFSDNKFTLTHTSV